MPYSIQRKTYPFPSFSQTSFPPPPSPLPSPPSLFFISGRRRGAHSHSLFFFNFFYSSRRSQPLTPFFTKKFRSTPRGSRHSLSRCSLRHVLCVCVCVCVCDVCMCLCVCVRVCVCVCVCVSRMHTQQPLELPATV